MLKLSLRGVKNNPFRYAATSLAIILGVAFFIATGVMTTSFRNELNAAIDDVFVNIDAVVQSSEKLETGFGEQPQPVPTATADQFLELDGVAASEPFIQGYAQVLTAEGKQVDNTQTWIGFNWIENETLNPYSIVDGRAPQSNDEIVVDINTFDKGDFELGQAVQVDPLPLDAPPFTIVGTIEAEVASSSTEEAVGFTLGAATEVFGDAAPYIFIDGAEGTDSAELLANLETRIDETGAPLEAVTGQELGEEFQELIGFFTSIIDTALKVFAGVALFVGAFVIYNTFSIIIAQRTKEMALLRAIGASGRQVSRSVLIEAIIVGFIASALGALAGIGIAWGLLQLLGSLFGDFTIGLTLPAGTLVTGIVIGLLITICSAWLPARRGARIAPIEALRDSEIEEVRAGTTRKIVGVGMLGGGLVLSFLGAGLIGDSSIWLLAIGVPLMIISIFLVAPIIVRPVTRTLSIPLVRRGNITGELARENAARNPKRTATTSLTLMIGVALMVTAAVFAATLSQAIRGSLGDNLLATDVVQVNPNVTAFGGGMDPSLAPEVANVEGVELVVPIQSTFAEIDGSAAQLMATDAATIDQVVDLGVVEGALTDLDEQSIAIADGVADDLDVGIGDRIEVKVLQASANLEVAAIYENGDTIQSAYLTDRSALEPLVPRLLDSRMYILSDGSDSTVAGIEETLATVPTGEVKTTDQYITDQASQVNLLLYLLYGLLGMAVVVALIGIINTMALSIHERTRELGLLRAVGMTRRQMKRSVRFESALVALMGTVVGILLGLLFGWLVYIAGRDNLYGFVIPWNQLIVVTVVGILAGVLAGVLPARRAAKLDVLKAIGTE